MYRAMGRMHAEIERLGRLLLDRRGQGTVEYVGLILLVALIMAGMVLALKKVNTGGGDAMGTLIVGKIKEAIRQVHF